MSVRCLWLILWSCLFWLTGEPALHLRGQEPGAPPPAVEVPPAAPAPSANPPATETPPVADPPTATPPADPPVAVSPPAVTPPPAAPDPDPKPWREQLVFVPFAKLEEVFGNPARGVFIPYERYQELYRLARSAVTPAAAAAPNEALITQIKSVLTVGQQAVEVTAELEIEVLGKHWTTVDLRLADAAIASATLDGAAAKVVRLPEGNRLHIPPSTESKSQHKLILKYVKAFERSPGSNRLTLQAPQAAINRWELRIPGASADVRLSPLVTASKETAALVAPDSSTNAPATGDASASPETAETVVNAFVGASADLEIQWTPKAEGATGLEALVAVNADLLLNISDGLVRANALLSLQVSRASIAQVELELPVDFKLVSLEDTNVRQWDVKTDGDQQVVLVQFFQAVDNQQLIRLELEKLQAVDGQQTIKAPLPKVRKASRQRGKVLAQITPGMRVEASLKQGLQQLDRAQMDGLDGGAAAQLGFRYAALPAALELKTEKLAPRIEAASLVELLIMPDLGLIQAETVIRYRVERAGVFSLELQVPESYEVTQVAGYQLGEYAPAQVESFARDLQQRERLVVNLASQALGPVALVVKLQRKLSGMDLTRPSAKPWELPLELPLVMGQEPVDDSIERRAGPAATASVPAAESLELVRPKVRRTGNVVVLAPPQLQVQVLKRDHLRNISPQEAYDKTPTCRADAFQPGMESVFAGSFADANPTLVLSVERRKPFVTAQQRLTAQLDSSNLHYDCLIDVHVDYSGVPSLRIDLPAAVAEKVRNLSSGLRESVWQPATETAAGAATPAGEERPELLPPQPGEQAWIFTGDRDLLGDYQIHLAWDEPLENLVADRPLKLSLPRLTPRGVDRANGQIILIAAEGIDLSPDGAPLGLRAIDPRHDLRGPAVPQAFRAFEFTGDWQLNLNAVRYEPQAVKGTSIDRAFVRLVNTRGGTSTVQALYRVRSSAQRILVRLPGDVSFDSQPVTVNGQSVTLEKAQQGGYSIPLQGRRGDEWFLLELRYSLPKNSQFQPPEFTEDVALQQVYLAWYAPRDLTLLSFNSDWTPEYDWNASAFSNRLANSNKLDDRFTWVLEGTPVQPENLQAFPVGGTPYLYSALRPSAGQSLQLSLLPGWLFHGLVCGGLILLTLAALSWSWSKRIWLLVCLAFGIAALAIFWPTLAEQLWNPAALAMAGVCGLTWLTAAVLDSSRYLFQHALWETVANWWRGDPPEFQPDSMSESGVPQAGQSDASTPTSSVNTPQDSSQGDQPAKGGSHE